MLMHETSSTLLPCACLLLPGLQHTPEGSIFSLHVLSQPMLRCADLGFTLVSMQVGFLRQSLRIGQDFKGTCTYSAEALLPLLNLSALMGVATLYQAPTDLVQCCLLQEPLPGEDAFVWQQKRVAQFNRRPQVPPAGALLQLREVHEACMRVLPCAPGQDVRCLMESLLLL